MRKRVSAKLCAAVFAAVIFMSCGGLAHGAFEDYTDISGHWSQEAMRGAYENGLIEGYDGRLTPDGVITRAQVITVICRALGAGLEADISGLGIPEGAWYKSAVAKGVYLGIVEAAPADFNAPVTREEAFGIILKAFQAGRALEDTSVLDEYDDTFSYSTETRRILSGAVNSGLVLGYGGKLNADRPISRAEFVTVLLRAAAYFGSAKELDGDMSESCVLSGDAELSGMSFGGSVYFACDTREISLSDVRAQNAVIRSDSLTKLSLLDGTSIERLVLANGEGDLSLRPENARIGTLAVGPGSGGVTVEKGVGSVEITGDGRRVVIKTDLESLTVSGDGSEVVIESGAAAEKVTVLGKGTAVEINGSVGGLILAGAGTSLSGSGGADTITVFERGFDIEAAGISAKELKDERGTGADSAAINILAPQTLPAGETLSASVRMEGGPLQSCLGYWQVDGAPVGGLVRLSADGEAAGLSRVYEYSRDMPKTSKLEFVFRYISPFGEAEFSSRAAVVNLENYGEDYYRQREVERVLGLVVSGYTGNYTLQYALDYDYQDYEKEIWVNAKGYSSDTQYLVWVNLTYQRVNIFEGRAGEWKLIRSGIVATGAPGTGTPVGVWKTTYKQQAGWTTGTYTVRPVVRFKGGGYAFHSRLYWPGTWTLNDDSIGFPVSHGCVRMYQEDIQWMYDNVPDGTTVVVY